MKWKTYQSNVCEQEKEYSLLYENGSEALFLPGRKEFSTLKRYKDETGKDYKRSALYLCTSDDLSKSEIKIARMMISIHIATSQSTTKKS